MESRGSVPPIASRGSQHELLYHSMRGDQWHGIVRVLVGIRADRRGRLGWAGGEGAGGLRG